MSEPFDEVGGLVTLSCRKLEKTEGEALVGFEFKKTLLKVMFDGFDACDVGLLRAFLGSVAELDDELLDAMCAESLSRRHVR